MRNLVKCALVVLKTQSGARLPSLFPNRSTGLITNVAKNVHVKYSSSISLIEDWDKQVCFYCQKPGHGYRHCPENKKQTETVKKKTVQCLKCLKTGHTAEECTSSDEQRTCYNCHEYGHIAANCPNPRVIKCYNCEELGHLSKDCPHPKNVNKRLLRYKCFICGEQGHISSICPNKHRDIRKCYKCNQTGHIAANCPNSDSFKRQ